MRNGGDRPAGRGGAWRNQGDVPPGRTNVVQWPRNRTPAPDVRPAPSPMAAAIQYLFDLAQQAGAVADPDALLFELCATALRHLGKAAECSAVCLDADQPTFDALADAHRTHAERARAAMELAARQPARTCAGLLCKALLCHATHAASATLSASLARDVLADPAIRVALLQYRRRGSGNRRAAPPPVPPSAAPASPAPPPPPDDSAAAPPPPPSDAAAPPPSNNAGA